jgi:hypothetical protein
MCAALAFAAWAAPAYALTGTITASPNYVLAPAGGLAPTTVSWSTSDGSTTEVKLVADGAPAKLFAQGPSGSATAPWIQSGSTYGAPEKLFAQDRPRLHAGDSASASSGWL